MKLKLIKFFALAIILANIMPLRLAFSTINIVDKATKILNMKKAPNEVEGLGDEKVSPESPRAQFEIFYNLLGEKQFKKAAEFLDLRHVKTKNKKRLGPELVKKIKYIFDRLYWHDPEVLATSKSGFRNDNLPFYRELLFEIEGERRKFPFYMDRVKVTPQKARWLVAPPTLSRVNKFYQEISHGWLGKYLPGIFFEIRPLEVPLWQWPIVLFIFLSTVLLSKLMGKWALKFLGTISLKLNQNYQKKVLNYFFPPLRLFFAILILSLIPLFISFPKNIEAGIIKTFASIVILNVIWFVFAIFDYVEFYLTSKIKLTQSKLMHTSLPLGKRTLKVLIGFIALLMLLQNWGINVTALFAGLGIGGIAFAFAGQKTMENIFGGLTLVFDRPARIGDLCRFDETLGHIEEIGLRSTKIRTLDRTVITIPNSDFCQLKIENIYRRNLIRFYQMIGLRYDTSTDQIRYLLVEIKKLLLAHPRVEANPCRVRLMNLNDYSIDIEVHTMINTTEWNDFLAVREDLLLRIMDIIRESGTDFAFPSTTIYTEEGAGINKEKQKNAEEVVRGWKEKKNLCLPEFSNEKVQEVWNKIEYPPVGSINKINKTEK